MCSSDLSVMDAVANVIGVVAVWTLVVSYRCQARRTTWVWMIISGVCFALAWTDGAVAQRMVLTLFLGGLVFMVSALSIRRTLA